MFSRVSFSFTYKKPLASSIRTMVFQVIKPVSERRKYHFDRNLLGIEISQSNYE